MVEPFTTIVVNSLLFTRSHYHSIGRMVMRPMQPAFPLDFFSPHPTPSKGKEKARDLTDNEYYSHVTLPIELQTGHYPWHSSELIHISYYSQFYAYYYRTKPSVRPEGYCASPR